MTQQEKNQNYINERNTIPQSIKPTANENTYTKENQQIRETNNSFSILQEEIEKEEMDTIACLNDNDKDKYNTKVIQQQPRSTRWDKDQNKKEEGKNKK